MPWTAEMDAQNISDAIDGGYLKSVDGNWSGNDTDAFVDWERLNFNTEKQDIGKGNMTATITFKHATNDRVAAVDKEIKLMGCLVAYENGQEKLYEVYGPVMRTWHEKTAPYADTDGTVITGATMIDEAQRERLADHGVTDAVLTTATEFEDRWSAYPSGSSDSQIIGRSFTATGGTGYFWTNTYDTHGQTYLLSQLVLRRPDYYCEAKTTHWVIGPPTSTKYPTLNTRECKWTFDGVTVNKVETLKPETNELIPWTISTIDQWPTVQYPFMMYNPNVPQSYATFRFVWGGYDLAFTCRRDQMPVLSADTYKNTKYKTYYVKEIN